MWRSWWQWFDHEEDDIASPIFCRNNRGCYHVCELIISCKEKNFASLSSHSLRMSTPTSSYSLYTLLPLPRLQKSQVQLPPDPSSTTQARRHHHRKTPPQQEHKQKTRFTTTDCWGPAGNSPFILVNGVNHGGLWHLVPRSKHTTDHNIHNQQQKAWAVKDFCENVYRKHFRSTFMTVWCIDTPRTKPIVQSPWKGLSSESDATLFIIHILEILSSVYIESCLTYIQKVFVFQFQVIVLGWLGSTWGTTMCGPTKKPCGCSPKSGTRQQTALVDVFDDQDCHELNWHYDQATSMGFI